MTTSLLTARLGWPDMHLTWVGSGAWAIGGRLADMTLNARRSA